jgi:transcriptional antiterminator NusG
MIDFEQEDQFTGAEPQTDPSDQEPEAQPEEITPESAEEQLPAAPSSQEDDGRAWYVVHCYSGYENKVRHNLEQRIDTMGMKDKIFDVVVPTEEEIEVKEGKRRTVERRVRPEEVAQIIKRMEAEAPRVKVTFKQSERVRIVDGPFNDFRGTVAEIDMERAKVRVMVNFFGRETPVELDFLQVEKA